MAKGNQRRLTRTLSGVLIFYALLLAVSIPYQRFHGDEAWLGEQAYFLNQDGVSRSELFHGFLHYEDQVLVAHKLFIALGAGCIGLLGWQLWSLRLLSLIGGGILIWLIFHHLRSDDERSLGIAWRVAVLFLLTTPLFFKFVNLYRPEVSLAACGFASYHLLVLYLDRRRSRYVVGSAILAGIAVLIHLNGLIYIGAGVVILFWSRRRHAAMIFASLALVIALLYFWDVIGHGELYRLQLFGDPALSAEDFRWDTTVWRLINEHKRLFRKPEIIFTSVLFFGALIYYWRNSPPSQRCPAIYALSLVVGLGIVGQAKTTPYAIALLPSFALVVGQATVRWLERPATSPRWVLVVSVVLWGSFALHSLVSNMALATTGKQNIAAANHRVAQSLIPGEAVLAPLDFVFNEIDHFRIRGLETAWLSLPPDRREAHTVYDIITYAESSGISAIILDEEYLDRMGLVDVGVGQVFGKYRVAARFTDIRGLILRMEDDRPCRFPSHDE